MIGWKTVAGYVHVLRLRQFPCQIFPVYSIGKNRGQEGQENRASVASDCQAEKFYSKCKSNKPLLER